MPNTYMPISLSLKGRRCLVVGGGPVALRKVEALLDYETIITVIAPEIEDKLAYYAKRGLITIEKRRFKQGEASAYGLVIAASDDRELNRKISGEARAARVLVNAVDDPAYCDFIFPAVIRRDCLTAAISTDGKAPFMSGHLRMILGTIFPEHWGPLMRHAAEFRRSVQEKYPDDPIKKQDCYSQFVELDWKTLLRSSDKATIDELLRRLLNGESISCPAAG
jgi:siroheme synthase-like protein